MAPLPGKRASKTDPSRKGSAMSDVIYLAIAGASFSGFALYVYFCERQ